MVTEYKLNSIADETAVQLAYHFILGRNPENQDVVSKHANEKHSIEQLRNEFILSTEYKSKTGKLLNTECIKQYLKCKADDKGKHEYTITDSYNEIILMSNSDPIRYYNLLRISSFYNKLYAEKHSMRFKEFVGIKRGGFPHHAMFNKAHMLEELVDEGYRGWVVHIDADAIFSRPDFSIRSLLSSLRKEGKVFAAHLVHPRGTENYSWWNINNGFFCIDLSSNYARYVAKAWAGVYKDLYSQKNYSQAESWVDFIINDQKVLWYTLMAYEMEDKIYADEIQSGDGFIRQALRESSVSVSNDLEIREREELLKEIGFKSYLKLPDPSKKTTLFGSLCNIRLIRTILDRLKINYND